MRILIFNWRDLAHPHAGGAEVYTQEVAKEWVAAGHDVTLFVSAVAGRSHEEIWKGVRILRRGSRLSVYREARRFYERHGEGRFDLVIDEINTRPFMCPTFVHDVPVVALVHQVARDVWLHEFPLPAALVGRHVLEPRWLKAYRTTPVLTVSPSSEVSLREHGIENIRVVPEGLSLPDRVPSLPKAKAPTAVFVGRLASNKRPDHALAAFGLLRGAVRDAEMWMVGSGPMEDALRRSAPPGVTFFGRVGHQEKFELLSRAHCVVVTSVREGWGLVVSEAAAVGTPAIAYDVPGLRDSVPVSGGVLVAPDPAALGARLSVLLPKWKRRAPVVEPGGVLPWDEVAAAILHEAKELIAVS